MALTAQQQFFYDHAGFSWDPKTETEEQGRERCAKLLAAAEVWAAQNGVWFEERYDEDEDLSWMSKAERRKEHEVIGVIAHFENAEGDEESASLWGIVDADQHYKRVIRAELASELQNDTLIEEIGEHVRGK